MISLRPLALSLSLPLLTASWLDAAQLTPRATIGGSAPQARPLPGVSQQNSFRLMIKFVDAARARADASGSPVSSQVDLSEVRALLSQRNARVAPAIRLPEARLAELEARAAERSGTAQPDLAGLLLVEWPDATAEQLEQLGARLVDLDAVEFTEIETLRVAPPDDIPPTTPDLVPMQSYRGPNPGIDADYALAQGWTGSGIRLSDCEYGWDPEHEDLVDRPLNLEPGQTIVADVFSFGWDDHGTAVLGETSGVPNAYGVSGMAAGAEVYTFPEWTDEEGFRRVTCITNAIAGSSAGDVVMLEMQTLGSFSGYGPAELDLAVWMVVKAGTDAGVIVVAAAGNGSQDLDSAPYAEYQSRGDSGAIIVGAGSADTAHDTLWFSTYGSRVNVQGWGTAVFTLGYGDFATYGGDPQQVYTDTFSGTSSATPFVASACCLLQEAAIQMSGAPLSPTDLRSLLIDTGIPQGAGGHIGPLVNLRDALDSLCAGGGTNYCVTSPNSAGAGAIIGHQGSTSLAVNDLILEAQGAVPLQSGIFFYGPSQAQVPFGDGQLCVTGGIYRMNPPQMVDAAGNVARVIDNNLPPLASGNGMISPGESWHWQFWYRDPFAGGSGYNLSDGLTLLFCD